MLLIGGTNDVNGGNWEIWGDTDANNQAKHDALKKIAKEMVQTAYAKASAAGSSVGKAGSAFAIGKVASKLFGKKDKKK